MKDGVRWRRGGRQGSRDCTSGSRSMLSSKTGLRETWTPGKERGRTRPPPRSRHTGRGGRPSRGRDRRESSARGLRGSSSARTGVGRAARPGLPGAGGREVRSTTMCPCPCESHRARARAPTRRPRGSSSWSPKWRGSVRPTWPPTWSPPGRARWRRWWTRWTASSRPTRSAAARPRPRGGSCGAPRGRQRSCSRGCSREPRLGRLPCPPRPSSRTSPCPGARAWSARVRPTRGASRRPACTTSGGSRWCMWGAAKAVGGTQRTR
mmetsp:Transcript_39953/g.127783  ORF Transcript_39953/g.127783 Transcript_39953/m.127783 type:complete len:265 (+) Transcript_39953:330-1124(+)